MPTTMTTDILISDLASTLNAQNRAQRPAAGKWTSFDYQAEDFAGSMIFTSNGAGAAPEVEIPLNAPAGTYAIFVGLYFGHPASQFWAMDPHAGGGGSHVLIRLRLSRDSTFDIAGDEYYGAKAGPQPLKKLDTMRDILEVRWKTAQLRPGEKLVLANLPHEALSGTLAVLAHVRLVPEAPAPKPTRRLVAHFDSSLFGGYPRNEQDVRELLEPFRDGDIRTLCWEMSKGENCYYPTKVGRVLPDWDDVSIYPHYIPRDLRELLSRANPLDLFPRIARELGMEFYASTRFMPTRFPFSFYTWPDDGGHFMENPDAWTVDEHGEPMPHYSFTHAKTQQLFLGMIAEHAAHDVDGLNMLFNRSYPFVLFEPAFVESFRAQHGGTDPRTLDRMDERIWRHRATFMTQFMRGVRAIANEAGSKRGRPMTVSAIVMNSPRHCLYFGLDVETWIREGLVDQLVLHPCFSAETFEDHTVTPENVRQFRSLVGDRDVRICPDLYPRHFTPENILPKILCYHDAGADGISLWDCYSRFWRKSEWSVTGHSGSAEVLRNWTEQTPTFWRKIKLQSFCGISFDKRYGIQTHG